MVPSLAPQHAFTRDVWKAVVSHTREWLTNPGARYPPGAVLEQLTAPTPGVRHALHRASALTRQLNDEVLNLALEPLRVLYPQTHIPPAGTSNRLGRLGLQRRVEAAHPGGVVEQWHSSAKQGAFPPLPNIDWRQGPTQAYYMSADPWPLAVLLHNVSAPDKRQEQRWVNPPTLVWSPDQEEHLRGAWQGDAIRATDVPDLHAGPITHARPAATLAVAQRGQQNPQWVVCMFSPADAHIVVCDPERLPGPEAVIRVADCTRMIIKALQEGEQHALLLQVRLKDNARAARPGVWPAAAHPADLELQLAVPTAVYHWLQAFHDLRWMGKPDRQIGSKHWQTWLQADAQRDAIRGLGPAPATRALDAATPGHTLAPHTVPLANLPFKPAAEGAIRKSVPLPPARGATEPTKCPLCADKYYTSGAMLEHLAWHGVHAAAPADDKEAATNILQGRARRSPWHPPYTRRPPPQAADHADGDEEAPGAAPGGRRCGPTRVHVHPRGAGPPGPPGSPGPPGPPMGPAGNGLSGCGAPRCTGCTGEPSGDADAG